MAGQNRASETFIRFRCPCKGNQCTTGRGAPVYRLEWAGCGCKSSVVPARVWTRCLLFRKRCFISNLSFKTSWQDLKDEFREVGNVVYANVAQDENGKTYRHFLCHAALSTSLEATALHHLDTSMMQTIECACAGKSRGWGIVEYETPEEVTSSAVLPCCGHIQAWLGCDATSSSDRRCIACNIRDPWQPGTWQPVLRICSLRESIQSYPGAGSMTENAVAPPSCLASLLCCA